MLGKQLAVMDSHTKIFVCSVLAYIYCIFYITQCEADDTTSRLDILRERLQRLERRLSDDMDLLRKEFYLEIESLSKHPVHGSDVTNDALAVATDDLNQDLQIFKDKLKSFQLGLADEKRIRRSVQDDLNILRDEEIYRDSVLANLSRDIRSVVVNTVENTDKINTASVLRESFNNLTKRIDVKEELNKIIELLQELKVNTANEESIKLTERVVDCADWRRRGHVKNGVYTVFPASIWRPLKVYCDMETHGGGWTVFQRRKDGSENFNRKWLDYTYGFGDLIGEFWLGNEFIHRLTSLAPQELRIELEDFDNDHRIAEYGEFSIGPASEMFNLTVAFFSGNVTDSLISSHNGKVFSTMDRGPSSSCSRDYKGGWWYGSCHAVNINGAYLKGEHKSYADGVIWHAWKGYHYSLKFTEMKFRSK